MSTRPPDRTECCPVYFRIPENCECFLPQMCCELETLFSQHSKMFTKRQRLHELAVPKRVYERFVPKCACKLDNPIEIVHLEGIGHTRTEQLALPAVRKLLLFRNQNRDVLDERRIEIINRLIRYSLMSMYSRLINVQPPVKPEPIHKWDKKEWKEHTKYLKKLAKPKKMIPVPKVVVKKTPLKQLKRFKVLAMPKEFEEVVKDEWMLTPEMKNYKPSERILKMSLPKTRDDEALYQSLPIPIQPNALTYKASPRIKELATPAEKRAGESDTKENPFGITPNALKAKPSQRIQELAEPKEYENKHIRDNPFAISPAALKAKASPRIIELAQPKGS